MTTQHRVSSRGVTLIELIAAIMVMSVIASVIMPVIVSSTESYATARTVRLSTESLAYASDQLQRVIRKAPSGEGGSGLGVLIGTSERVEFLDGTGVELVGTDLSLLVPGGDPVVLCRDVDMFRLSYIGDDGRTSVLADPTTAHRVGFRIQNQGSVISAVAFPRVWIGQEGS
jgi:prepilin-type N-terminal cleavage/methylation domain-containing protein